MDVPNGHLLQYERPLRGGVGGEEAKCQGCMVRDHTS